MSENMQKNFLLDFQTYSVCKKQHNADYVVKYKNERGFSNAGKRRTQTEFCKRLYKRKN